MKLIVNADDFGYSKGVNLGIVEAHREGVVTSATLMVNMEGFEHAVGLAKEHPTLGVGIHLVLTCGSPVSQDVPSLTDGEGRFRRGQDHLISAAPEEIERELRAQLGRFVASGLKLTHIDSHHHVHAHPAVLPIVLKLAEEYRVPVRYPWMSGTQEQRDQSSVLTTEGFSHHFYGDDLTVQSFVRIVEDMSDYPVVEIMTHPAYLDEAVLTGSSYAKQRTTELKILTAAELKQYIRDQKIQLVTFSELG
ncbi:chitin disaccharide deacetylase [Brevibacillus sp. HB2.2]|uniref:chitin disaccharide deacetylase n=1 Tax=Brevibacillus sp. HB2.2 TaxID=2738846 RepID=UPI00156B84AE|nr:chitin disaccharide deacetylase [Brevibacillus sp. HB2.2]NRS46943.1 chitin disaccharide deacetylase [Brevibacillus sp. HB2.2]